jgi:DNA-binding MarR family transcriptional regulator
VPENESAPNRDVQQTAIGSTHRSSEEIGVATRRLDVALSSLRVTLARRLGVSQPELAAITHVSAAGDLGPTELAHRLDVTTGAVTALVDRLAERGHLVRQPHPADRRRLELHVTPHARDEVLRHILPLSADIRALADTFSAEERDAIGRFLEELAAIVQRHAEHDPAHT